MIMSWQYWLMIMLLPFFLLGLFFAVRERRAREALRRRADDRPNHTAPA